MDGCDSIGFCRPLMRLLHRRLGGSTCARVHCIHYRMWHPKLNVSRISLKFMTLTRKLHTTIINGVTKLDLFISYSKVRIFIGLFPEAPVLPPTGTLAIISFMMLVSFLSEPPPMKRYEFYLPFSL